MGMTLAIGSILAGFIGLIWSAEKFVLGASTTAKNLGVSPLIIGLTIVAFGTSAPEIFTAAAASLKGSPELAVGNALGSNIANIGLVLGITALVCPLSIPTSLVKKELPALLLITISVFFIFLNLRLSYFDGVILLAILALFTWQLFISKSGIGETEVDQEEDIAEFIAEISTTKSIGWMLIGLVLMIFSSYILVIGATDIALALGVSELVIGLTIVAIGTSLPELAASITSALKGHHELAVGNIIGSNILNLLMVLSIPAFLSPFNLDPVVLWRDYSSMLLITLLLTGFIVILVKKQQKIGRVIGAVLLLFYLSYTGLLFLY